jgi:hypothetical protein
MVIVLGLITAVCVEAGVRTHITTTPGIRVSGPLPMSLQNEVDAAIDRSRTWLVARQDPDGSWNGSNRVDLTAVVWLALVSETTPATTSAVARAWTWLAQQTNAGNHVWLQLAKAVQAGDVAGADRTCRDLCTVWVPADPAVQADELPRLWLEAWQRNRGIIAATAANEQSPPVIDWRSRTARQLVNSQLSAPDLPGAGYWQKAGAGATRDWTAEPVARTSFALLALQEL